ncbi:MAG TPA: VOC family protein, partial [Candidatus Tectomicrobia bacterium]|nr:VOC family protein [Candidatus Tectomicrobia bacterium]
MSGIRLDHVALAVPRMADAAPFLAGVLGGRPAYGGSSRVYRFGQWRFANRARLEVLEPLGADGFLHRFLGQRGPGVHHVTFKVPSLREACARAEAHGYTIVGHDDSDPHWKEAFLHPRQALGIVVQLAESAPGSDGPSAWTPPPAPSAPPPAVAVIGLRMRARSRERARTQWEAVLQGEAVLGGEDSQAADSTVIYRWPRSPLRIVVEIDAARDEG